MRILVTGSRKWADRGVIDSVLVDLAFKTRYQEKTLVHGKAPGADAIAAEIAESMGWIVEEHPANWKKYGKNAGPIRNQEMVDLGADLCIAFPDEDSTGTWDCMERAEAAKIKVINHGVTKDDSPK